MAQTNKLGKLLSDSVIYGLSSIVGRFLNYLLVPLYTYKIAASSGGYGVVTNIYAYTALLLVLLTFGMETTFFYFANRKGGDAKRTFSTATWSVASVAGFFVALCFIFIGPLSRTLGYEAHPEYIEMMAVVVGIDAFQAILFAQLRFAGKAWKFATLKLLFIFLSIGLNLFVFLAAPKLAESAPQMMGWYDPNYQVGYVFLINLICTTLITLGFIPELKNLKYGIDFRLLKEMLRYTWPLLLLGLMGILNQVADKICFRFLVPGSEGDVQLGIYGACVKIAMIMAMITQAFRYAYEPFVFAGGTGKESKESQALVMKYFVMFTLLAFLAVVCYMPLLRYIIKSDYWEGLRAVPIVMMAEIFMGIYFNLSFWYKLIGKTWWGAIMSAIGCVALLAVNIIFVPRYGYMACAWGGFVGYSICMILSYFIGQHYNPVPYRLLPIFGYFALTMGLFAVCQMLTSHIESTVMQLIANTGVFVIYVAVVAYCERRLVKQVVGGLRRKLLKH